MSKDDLKEVEIYGMTFKSTTDAKHALEEYFLKLEKQFKDSGDSDEIISDIKSRIVEHFAAILKNKEEKYLSEGDIEKVIEKMGGVDDMEDEIKILKKNESKTNKGKFKKFLRVSGYVLFWGPHLMWIFYTFAMSIFMLVATFNTPEILTLSSILTYLGIFLLPTIGCGVGLYLTKYGRLKDMLMMMLAIEIPLFLLSGFRIVVMQVVSPAVTFGFALIAIACIAMLLDIIDSERLRKYKEKVKYFNLFAYGAGTFMSFYVFIIWFFFFPYVIWEVLEGLIELISEIFRFNPYGGGFGLGIIPFTPFALLIFSLATLFYMSPAYVFPIYFGKMLKTINESLGNPFVKENGKLKFIKKTIKPIAFFEASIPFVSIILSLLIIWGLSFDFNQNRRDLIARTLEETEDQEYEFIKQSYLKLYQNEDKTRDAVVEKFIARYQYMFDDHSDDIFDDLYCKNPLKGFGNVFYDSNLSYEEQESLRSNVDSGEFFNKCRIIYGAFSFFANPVVYNGDLRNDFYDAEIEFEKLFDDNIQREERDKIKRYTANTFGDSLLGGWGRNMEAGLVDEDRKNVRLTELKVDSNINEEFNLHKTSYTFTFKNKELSEEEVYFEFSLPEGSVMTDLKLGPNLENPGQVAPKAAAHEVYENSLQRRIDPALLELIGPRTYRLRVYPIPPKGGDTQIRWSDGGFREEIEIPDYQKVYFEYSGVIGDEYKFLIFPYTRNIDTSDVEIYGTLENISKNLDRSIMSEDINYNKAPENIFDWHYDGQEFKRYIKEDSLINYSFKNLKNLCYKDEVTDIENINPSSIRNVRIFFDISKSSDSKKTIEGYKEVSKMLLEDKSLGSYSNAEIYEFNFDSNFEGVMTGPEVQAWLGSTEFWGYSDKSKIAETLINTDPSKNYITYIITDDSDFEFDEEVNYEFDYTQNVNNQINLIQVGSRLTAQKEEINNLIWSSGGQSYLWNLDLNYYEKIKDMKVDSKCNIKYEDFDNVDLKGWKEVIDDLKGLEDAKLELRKITDSAERIHVARALTFAANDHHIVDPMNSMIALQTEWQQRQLDNATKGDDAYDLEHDIGEEDLVVPNLIGGGNTSLPEADTWFSLIVGLILVLFVVGKEKRKNKLFVRS